MDGCRCKHNQSCEKHKGLAGWLRRFRAYFLLLRMGNVIWLQTPLGGLGTGEDDPSVILVATFLPRNWRLFVPEGGRFYRFAWRFRRNPKTLEV